MADTFRWNYPDRRCDDCGSVEVCYFTNSTLLVPSRGYFCQYCFTVRCARSELYEGVLPIGTTSYLCRGKGKKIVITFNRESLGPRNNDFTDTIMTMYRDCRFADLNSTSHESIDSYSFAWGADLDHNLINERLNALRARFPSCAISFVAS
jgi:hypothetical protein